jgi:hypothetical protein
MNSRRWLSEQPSPVPLPEMDADKGGKRFRRRKSGAGSLKRRKMYRKFKKGIPKDPVFNPSESDNSYGKIGSKNTENEECFINFVEQGLCLKIFDVLGM